MDHPDKRLAERMLDGEEHAFREFFDTFAMAVYRFAVTRLGKDAGHADDVTQATLTKAVARLETYRGEAGLFSWLCTFCRHEISAFYQRRDRRPQEVDLGEGSDEVRMGLRAASVERSDDPESSAYRNELAAEVQASLAEIPPPYGTVLEWKYIDGHSASEIAQRLGLSVKAAESLLTRARKAFRERFSRRSGRSPLSGGSRTRAR